MPDALFEAVDSLARKLGVSRSKLVATALAEYVAKHRSARVTERLDAVYSAEASYNDAEMTKAHRRTMRRTEW